MKNDTTELLTKQYNKEWRNKILALTDNKVDVIDDKGNYKSKETLLNELAQVWDSLKGKDNGKQTK